jgi:putative DNA primase/helicase
MSFDNIPEELRALNQWVVWRTELREGSDKPTKVPYQARKKGFHHASTTNPDTWTAFDFATRRASDFNDMDGIGFVFTPDDPYLGLDLDDVGDDDPFGATELIERADTYAEISPSGTGIHLIGRGVTPNGEGRHPKGLGIFQQHRFFTMTGNLLDGEIRPIRNIQAIIDANWTKWFPENPVKDIFRPESTPARDFFPSDREIVEKIRDSAQSAKFSALWDGSVDDHGGDHSAADLALCSILAFWTQDRDQIARLMGQSALGRRDKWRKRADYREMTITKSLQRSEFYTPPTNSTSGLTIIRSKSEDGTESQVFTFNTTDKGNSYRVIHHFGETIRYCHTTSDWLIWNGQRWRVDDDNEILRICMATAETIYDEAEAVKEKSEDLGKSLRKWAVRSEEGARLTSMPKLTQAFRELGVRLSDLDSDPYLLNVTNGTINLRDGSFDPHDRNDLLTRLAPVRYDPSACSPTWERFLATVFDGNADLIRFVQKCLGYSLTGDVTERALFILYGSGRNGKSTLVETVGRILGDYSTTSSAELVSARKGDAAMPTDLARLVGIRFTAASETGEYSRLDEARVKHITGGDRIVGERKYRDPFEYDPQFKIWLSTNHQPMIRGIDDGIWDRIRLIPFTVRIADENVDRYLKDKLLREAPGILNWLVQGALLWQSEGIGKDSDVSAATASYRESMDSLGFFLQEEVVMDSLGSETVSLVYAKYEEWARKSGEFPISKRALTNRLRDRGFKIEAMGNRKIHTIIGLRLPFPSEMASSTTSGSYYRPNA